MSLKRVLRSSTSLTTGFLAFCMFTAEPVKADPVTLTAIAASAIGTAVGSSATVIAFFGGSTTLAALFGSAITFGLNYLGSQLFASQQSPNAQSSLRTRQTDTYPPFRFAIGEFPQEGALVFKWVDEDYLYFSLLLSSIPIDGGNVVVKMNDIQLDLAGDITDFELGGGAYPETVEPYASTPDEGHVVNRADADHTELVVMWLQTGGKTKFPQDWIDYLSTDLPDISTATWEGTAVLHVRCRYGDAADTAQTRWFSGVPPKVEIKCKWAKLYDPREDPSSGTTQSAVSPSGTQSWDDPTTWTYSANPALAYLTILMHEKGLAVPEERVIVQMFADAADACDVGDATRAAEVVFSDTFDTAANILDRSDITVAFAQKILGYTRGELAVSGGNLQVISADTDGTLADDDTARFGLYFDLPALGLDPGKTYNVTVTATPSVSVTYKTRYSIATAPAGGAADDDFASITQAQAASYSLPPDSGSPTEVYDSGFLTDSVAWSGAQTVPGDRYVGLTMYGGTASGDASILESDGNIGTGANINDAASRTITFSETLQENDVVVLFLTSDLSISPFTITESGYLDPITEGDLPGFVTWGYVRYKRMGATPDTSVTITNNSGNNICCLYFVVRGAATTGVPWYTSAPNVASSSGGSGNPNPPAATSINPGDLHVVLGEQSDRTLTPATELGWTVEGFGEAPTFRFHTGFIYSKNTTGPGVADMGELSLGGSDDWSTVHMVFRAGVADFEIPSMTVSFEEASTRKKFECHGLVPIQSREYDTLQGVLDSMAGYLDTSAGGVGVKAGVWDAPSVSLSVPLAESFNYTGRADPGADKFVGVYLGEHNDYQKTETLPYVLDATGDRSQSIPLSMVKYADQAQRITKIMALRARHNRTMQGVWGPEEYARRVAETVDFTWSLIQGKADGDWICAEERMIMSEAEDGFIVQRQLAFRETASEIYDWDPDVDFPDGADVVIAPPVSVSKPGTPQNLALATGNEAAIPLTSTATAASDYQSAVRARWEPSTGTITDYEVQYQAISTIWQPLAIVTSDSSFVIDGTTYFQAITTPIAAGVSYTVRVRARGPGGQSDWASATITATAPTGTVRDYSSDYSLDYS